MKLHWSPRSPFVRKVMVVAHELGIEGDLQLVRSPAIMTEINAELSKDNPLNKLPTLVLADGSALYDSAVICDFLDAERELHPTGTPDRIDALRRQSLADGCLDLLVLLRNELGRPPEQQSSDHIKAWETKIVQALRRMDEDVAQNIEKPFDIGHIATGCALGYLDFRFVEHPWRSQCPALSTWAAAFENRPSAQSTIARDE